MSNPIDQTITPTKSQTPALRERFNTEVALKIANKLGLPDRQPSGYSKRFAFFAGGCPGFC